MQDLHFQERVGSGTYGAVYRGQWNGKEVAIKKLFVEQSGHASPEQLKELEKEVIALQSVRHDKVVEFLGACLISPNLCIVTEFMPGGSLHARLHVRRERFAYAQQLAIALDIGEGVAFLHSHQPPVVHRDLKSQNIVLDLRLGAKLCDFGLTQSMEKTHISVKEGGMGGSPRYMAPECYDSRGKITEKVDIWAVGCLLVEIFGGPLPYEECTNIQQIMAKVLVERQAPRIPHSLPAPVRELCAACFQFELDRRIEASAVYAKLRHLHAVQKPG
jgi:serine/threonine protein kinase